ncbi:protease pro-enzyme activation domain-containing protein [uncultured Jatrophihabitans sp.]|uniref:S53 family peptidase n=1 Tax=uncultured Jatrophihabitans sp. TaxID=1610747 RepID=UPI0035C9A0CB
MAPSGVRPKVIATGAAFLLAGAAAVALSPSAQATPAWSPTATKALSLLNATALGAAPSTQPLQLTVGLAPRNRAALDSLIRQQATPGTAQYRHYLTPAQFTSQFAATSATADAVRSYLVSQGMSGVTVASNRLQVTATATVAQAQKAFNTHIARYTQAGKTVLANTAAAQVPTSLSGAVSSVLGLSTLGPKLRPSAGAPTVPGLPKLTGFYPKEYNTVYHSGTTKPGTGTTLAVIAQGDLTQTVRDLRIAEAKQGLPQIPVTMRYSGVKSPDTSGAVEWNLDTQTSTGIAPNASRLYLYISTSLTDSDLARSINDFAARNEARSANASLGECDVLPYLTGAMTVDDIAFAEAAAQGQTFFASSGDTGSSCPVAPTNGVPGSGPTDTSYPASSPYVLGVGGTTLAASTANAYQSEIAWNAGGGGVSPVETAPYWTSTVNPVATAGLRGVPDVAFDADPTTGANIYATTDGATTTETVGGTSLASPLAMGLWTRILASHSTNLGFAPPKLYNYYTATQKGLPTTAVPGFHDITLGANGVYTALPGYDFTTGLGSWDVQTLSSKLS